MGLTSGTLKLIAISSEQDEDEAKGLKILPQRIFAG
jgi:hypothetical protein